MVHDGRHQPVGRCQRVDLRGRQPHRCPRRRRRRDRGGLGVENANVFFTRRARLAELSTGTSLYDAQIVSDGDPAEVSGCSGRTARRPRRSRSRSPASTPRAGCRSSRTGRHRTCRPRPRPWQHS
ncbi:hypothetical protein NKG05_11625 [Oerskovia sp. M15]